MSMRKRQKIQKMLRHECVKYEGAHIKPGIYVPVRKKTYFVYEKPERKSNTFKKIMGS